MVTFREIDDAFSFVNSAEFGMNTAILCKDTGRIYYRSEYGTIDEIDEDELDCDEIIRIPHKNDIGLGRELVFEFVEQHLADECGRVQQIFQSRGAYGRFRDLLEYNGLLQRWYDFQNQREEEVLRQWCMENKIELTPEPAMAVDSAQASLLHADDAVPAKPIGGASIRESTPGEMKRLSGADWSKQEKEIARRAYNAAYERECAATSQKVRKMAAGIKGPADMWRIHDYLTERRKDMDQKYDYRYSVLILVFARLVYEGWLRLEDLEGLSGDKLQKIRAIAEL